MTFCELREKDVINIKDCKRLGTISDLIFDCKTGCIQAMVIAHSERFWGFWGRENACEIPWCKIRQIGPDIILVDLDSGSSFH